MRHQSLACAHLWRFVPETDVDRIESLVTYTILVFPRSVLWLQTGFAFRVNYYLLLASIRQLPKKGTRHLLLADDRLLA